MSKIKLFLVIALISLVVAVVFYKLNLAPKPNKKTDISDYKKWKIFLISPEDLNSSKKKPDSPEVIYLSIDGQSTPSGRSGDTPNMVIKKISVDKSYGYKDDNPIKVGGAEKREGSANAQRYLNSLYGPNGEIIEYERIGSCCPFSNPNGIDGVGSLDMFKITYQGLNESIILSLNTYDYKEPKAPYRFNIKPKKPRADKK